jgi:Spy/CpxP family protein refolding chaperone
MMIRRFAVLVVAAALVSGTVAWAAPDDPAAPPRAERHGHKFQQWLGLTDDQMTQIRTLRQRDAEAWKQTGTALGKAQNELRQLALGGGSADAVQAKQTEVQQLLGRMVELRVKHLQEMAPLLTDEQRQKLAQGQRGHGRHHHGRRPQQS